MKSKSLDIQKNKVYCGDVLELIKKIPDNKIDLIIADPPYGIGKVFDGKKEWTLQESSEWYEWTKKWLNECYRVLNNNGSIFVYGIHHNIGYLQTYLYELGLNYGRMFIWHYENGWSRYTTAPAATYEPILWFHKGSKYIYNTIREPYKSTERLKHKIIKNGKVWTPNPLGKHGGDVWNIPTLAGKRFAEEKVNHPTQKPLTLCNKIVKHFSNPDDLILVPFAGSGSECVSAKSLGRNYIGFEVSKEYVLLTRERLKKLNNQG